MLLNPFTTRPSFLSILARLVLLLVLTMAAMDVLFVISSLAAPGNPVLDPSRNSHAVPLTTTVSVTYDEPIGAATVTSHTFVVHAMQTGLVTPTHGLVNGGHTIIVTPSRAFQPAELVQTTANTIASQCSGNQLHISTYTRPGLPIQAVLFGDRSLGISKVTRATVVNREYHLRNTPHVSRFTTHN